MRLPLFPLRICLLPEGYTQLRIFEPRYKRLVAESLRTESGFGLCMQNDTKQILNIGTLAQITDFETLSDGMLGITIKGLSRFKLNSYDSDNDGLKHGMITLLPNWPSKAAEAKDKAIIEALQEMLGQFPEHLHHYSDEHFEDISWACQRWLEVLPLKAEQKEQCIQSNSHQATLQMLHTLF